MPLSGCACSRKLTVSPNFSPLSAATLSETDIADIRRGWVQIILHKAPWTDSNSDSKMNWGICVVFPHPVSPEMITTCKKTKNNIQKCYSNQFIDFKHFNSPTICQVIDTDNQKMWNMKTPEGIPLKLCKQKSHASSSFCAVVNVIIDKTIFHPFASERLSTSTLLYK